MWSKTLKKITFSGSVMADASSLLPLRCVLVDVYRFTLQDGGKPSFEHLNAIASRTSETGDFEFTDLDVTVEVQTVIPGSPPYDPVELVNPLSLPNLCFKISVESEVLVGGSIQGDQFIEVYDERELILEDWIVSHPERIQVLLTGNPPIPVLVPGDNEEAVALAGIPIPAAAVPGREFHFLRVGRAIRQELGEFADARPEYVGKTGYMRSTNTWMAPLPSFFPGVIDAPFGRTLQIGGHFGADFLTSPRSDNLYYTVSFWAYTGDPDDPYDPAHLSNEKQILSHLFNKKYLLPTTAFPKGKWETLDLGPFEGTITAVEPTLDPALVGTTVHVYKRPSLADLLTEYWPFWDLIAIWNSNTAPDGLVVFTLEVYEKSGGTDENPELTKLEMTPSINGHLPLVIDNRRPVPKLFNWRTAFAQFSPENVISIAPFGSCGEMPVSVGHVNSNECILVEYSIEDQDGNPHPHINHYNLWIEFTPRQVVGAPLSKILTLKGQGDSPANPPFGIGLGYRDINGSYEPGLSGSPVYTVQNHESVLVPNIDDGWPPEPAGDPPSPCVQYAAEVGLRCSVRTINGWGRLFGNPHNSRHIIIRRG